MPAGGCPNIFSAIPAFGFEFSQHEYELRLAHVALAARDRKRHHDAVAHVQVLDLAYPRPTTSPMNS